MKLHLLIRSIFILTLLISPAFGVICGSTPSDPRFLAVCGLQRRSIAINETWQAEGSGVLVQWTDAQSQAHVGIVSIRHFVDNEEDDHGVWVQEEQFYAFFAICPEPSLGFYPLCVGPNEDMFHVRVKRFMLPDVEFAYEGASIVVGEVDPEDLPMLLHYITPLTLQSPIEAGVCRDQSIYISGWGDTCATDDAITLHIAASTLTAIVGETDGRFGEIRHPLGNCGSLCVPGNSDHDSGGAIIVDGPDNSLVVIGINQSFSLGIIAVRHQYFTDPQSTHFLCEPCGPIACYDVADTRGNLLPDNRQSCTDLAVLQNLGPRSVNCWCPGDLDGNGCAGDSFDIITAGCAQGPICNPNQWCYGDANLDGRVDEDDLDFLEETIDANYGPITCASCTACPAKHRWCCGDLNCDGIIDEDDIVIVVSLLTQYPSGYDCAPNSPGCESLGTCP